MDKPVTTGERSMQPRRLIHTSLRAASVPLRRFVWAAVLQFTVANVYIGSNQLSLQIYRAEF